MLMRHFMMNLNCSGDRMGRGFSTAAKRCDLVNSPYVLFILLLILLFGTSEQGIGYEP